MISGSFYLLLPEWSAAIASQSLSQLLLRGAPRVSFSATHSSISFVDTGSAVAVSAGVVVVGLGSSRSAFPYSVYYFERTF